MFLKNHEKKDGVNGLVAVAIDKEKGSQNALKWAVDNLLTRSSTVILIHVKLLAPSLSSSPSLFAPRISGLLGDDSSIAKEQESQQKNIFLPYRVFCTRKDIQCKDVILEDVDVSKAIIEYASQAGIEHLVLGCSTKNGLFKRFKLSDIPGTISKGAPDFCTVYVISKNKIHSTRSATRPAPAIVSNLFSQASVRSNQSAQNVPLAQSLKG